MSEPVPTRVSYAQNNEDVRVWRALRGIPQPFYVEVGASHPFDDSLTAALSAEGWHGLLVEPEPSSAELLREARPRDVVVAAGAHDRPGILTWSDLGTRGRGTVDPAAGATRTVAVPAVRLSDLLDDLAPEAVHFMSVDVEGHEKQALAGLDLSRWRPWLLCVEATLPGARTTSYEGWEPWLLEADYDFVVFDGLNRWYVAQEHADLAEAVAEPYGVLDRMLDGWIRHEQVEVTRDADRLRTQLEEQARLLEATEQRLAETKQLGLDRSDACAREVLHLHRELDLVASQRDAAVARERVMLTSKSWRLTSPLRGARRNATTAAVARRVQAGAAVPVAPPARESTQSEQRRHRALLAKVSAAASRRPS